jgi:hypothetical protein
MSHSQLNFNYGAHFYRYYFFNQDHVNYLGIDKDIGPVSISIKRDKIVFIDNNQHQSEHVYRFIMRISEVNFLFFCFFSSTNLLQNKKVAYITRDNI